MVIGSDRKWRVYAGQDYWDLRWRLYVAWGYRPDAPANVIPWRHFWEWSFTKPRLIRDRSQKIIGYNAFGRCRIFR